jgi:hypothetical protein
MNRVRCLTSFFSVFIDALVMEPSVIKTPLILRLRFGCGLPAIDSGQRFRPPGTLDTSMTTIPGSFLDSCFGFLFIILWALSSFLYPVMILIGLSNGIPNSGHLKLINGALTDQFVRYVKQWIIYSKSTQSPSLATITFVPVLSAAILASASGFFIFLPK